MAEPARAQQVLWALCDNNMRLRESSIAIVPITQASTEVVDAAGMAMDLCVTAHDRDGFILLRPSPILNKHALLGREPSPGKCPMAAKLA